MASVVICASWTISVLCILEFCRTVDLIFIDKPMVDCLLVINVGWNWGLFFLSDLKFQIIKRDITYLHVGNMRKKSIAKKHIPLACALHGIRSMRLPVKRKRIWTFVRQLMLAKTCALHP